jgi:hypothetical protein
VALEQLKVSPEGLEKILSALDSAHGYPREGERVGGGIFVPFMESRTIRATKPILDKEGDLYFSIDTEVLSDSAISDLVYVETTKEQIAWEEAEKVSILELTPKQLSAVQKTTK